MSSAANHYQGQAVSQRRVPQIEFIAFVFWGLGIAIIAAVFYIILSDETIIGRDVRDAGTRLWNLVQAVGILRPILALFAGALLIRLGMRLRTGYVGAARWARLLLLWLLVIAGAGIAQIINAATNSELQAGEASGSEFIIDVLPWAAALALFFVTLTILNRSLYMFRGDEDVTAIRTRTAWNLLAPTLLVFLAIGISPLEQVFIRSLTNERFASSAEVEFIGLNNYAQLLGMRLDEIPCSTDEITGECLTELDDNGNIVTVYPSSRRYLSDNIDGYRSRDYRPMDEIHIFGTRYAISARDSEFIQSFVSSVIYTVVAIGLQLVIGMFMAMVLTSRLRGMTLMRVALLVPLAVPTLIATQFWDVMLLPNEAGVANNFLLQLGLINEPQRWLLEPSLQLPSVIIVIVWKETPSMALLLLPGLLNISPELYQAASVDGANRWQQFWRITMPMMRPTIGVALVLRTMVMLRVFDVFEILLERREFSMATYAYDVLLQRQEFGYSSAVSVMIFFIILIFTVIYMRSLRIDES